MKKLFRQKSIPSEQIPFTSPKFRHSTTTLIFEGTDKNIEFKLLAEFLSLFGEAYEYSCRSVKQHNPAYVVLEQDSVTKKFDKEVFSDIESSVLAASPWRPVKAERDKVLIGKSPKPLPVTHIISSTEPSLPVDAIITFPKWSKMAAVMAGRQTHPVVEMRKEDVLQIERIQKASPLVIGAFGVVSALTLAVILSGGKVDLKVLTFTLKPLGEGIKHLRAALWKEGKPKPKATATPAVPRGARVTKKKTRTG